ncbi:MAG: heavy-metal-associated domain-containing protein [Rikenellaceae bacterium]
MKKIILLVIAMVMTVGVAEISAASKTKTTKAVIETTQFKTDIDCDHCVQKVMSYMPTQKGIKEVSVDLPKKVITISYDSEKTNTKTIIKRFKNIAIEASVIEPKVENKKVATPATPAAPANNKR